MIFYDSITSLYRYQFNHNFEGIYLLNFMKL